MQINASLTPADLSGPADRLLALAATKVRLLADAWDPSRGTPVFTVAGQYTTRGWTEWTQGFQYGCAILAFDATGDRDLLELGRRSTRRHMASHVTHTGVHDHGFNNLCTYGNLRRLMREGRIAARRVGTGVLRTGPQGQRRGAGGPLVRGAGRGPVAALGRQPQPRLRLLLQRPALAVRRHDAHRPHPRRRLATRPRPDARERPPGRPAQALGPARADHQPVHPVPRRLRPHLRRPRPHRPRGGLQPQRRQLPLPQHPAGLLALQHLDPRPGLGDARLRRGAGVLRHDRRRRVRGVRRPAAPGRDGRPTKRPPAPPATTTSTTDRLRRHPLLGRRRARPGEARRLARRARPTRSTITSRSIPPPPPSPPRGCCGWDNTWADTADGERYVAGGADGGRDAVRGAVPVGRRRRTRACCCTRSTTAPTAGTTSRRAGRCPAASRACGAITTRWNWRCTSAGWRRRGRT